MIEPSQWVDEADGLVLEEGIVEVEGYRQVTDGTEP